jgi:chemotaxis protein CheY-P-specific phosphatase CheC
MQTVSQIFEDMYYMFPELISDPDTQFSLPMHCYVSHTEFIKENGSLFFYAEEKLLDQMAMNFLGENRSFERIELIDIFREAANVIAGNYITATNKPPKVSFKIPVVDTIIVTSWDNDSSFEIDCVYNIENYFFRIILVE